MESGAKFLIQGTLCRVVPDHLADDLLVAERSAPASSEHRREPSLRVAGGFLLDGKRYAILCADARAEALPDEAPKVVNLLTRRELEVAMLVSEGEGNKQVADRLKLSEWTVSTYLRRIYAKLGVRSRAAMVARIVAPAHR
jgi:DNA-binding CsgD family transcriptional regulator